MNNNNYDSYLNNASDFPLTLEWHLQRMAERASHDPRYKQLCLIWEKTKNFLAGILSHNNAQYYTYSFHDASHSAAVVANIEQILGDRRIAKLSATDTFMILFTCYMHDIGMAIMQSDLNDLCENKNQEIEAELEKDKEANQFFSKLIQAHKKNDFNGVNDCLKQFVCDYICGMPYANLLLSNVFRGNHGANSLNVLKKIICGSNDTSNFHKVAHIVFDDLALPIIEHAGMICKLHTVPRQNREKALEEIIKDIKDYRQSGYCGDHYHPRFVAVLLQLGDLMDLGSSRYDVLYEMYYGKRDGLSKIHFDKHQAIEGALVDADKIRYSANATSVEALRLLHNETEWINAVLKFAATHWGEIAPKNFEGNLPTFILDPLKLNGEVIPDKLVSQEFVIEQKRAFELLKGSNIYETHFTFVREFIQNAFDATMLQCWREYKQRHPNCDPNALHLNSLTTEICKDIAKYSVCVSFHFCKEVGDKYYYVTEDDLKDYVLNKERPREFKTRFGLLVCISDHGIGISEEDLSIISEIGTSYNEKKAEIAAMPSFLKPSGTFGVGMQSAFKQCDRFFATTCAVESKAWEIEFTPLSGSRKGCISAVPIKGGSFPKGTTFKVFLAMDDPNVVVPVDKIALWAGDCTFSDNFEQYYPLKKAEALAHYIIKEIDELIKAPILPICAYVDFGGKGYVSEMNGIVRQREIEFYDFLNKNEEVKEEEKENEWPWYLVLLSPKTIYKSLCLDENNKELKNARFLEFEKYFFKYTKLKPCEPREVVPQQSNLADISYYLGKERARIHGKTFDESYKFCEANLLSGITQFCRLDTLNKDDGLRNDEERFRFIPFMNKQKVGGEGKDSPYIFDFQRMTLYVLLLEYDVKVKLRVSIDHFYLDPLHSGAEDNKNEEKHEARRKTAIYYKGIHIQDIPLKDDLELFEYIDIYAQMKKEYIRLNREGLTNEGIKFVRDEIYYKVLKVAKDALRNFADSHCGLRYEQKPYCQSGNGHNSCAWKDGNGCDRFKAYCKKHITVRIGKIWVDFFEADNKKEPDIIEINRIYRKWNEKCLSLIAFYLLSQSYNEREINGGSDNRSENGFWKDILKVLEVILELAYKYQDIRSDLSQKGNVGSGKGNEDILKKLGSIKKLASKYENIILNLSQKVNATNYKGKKDTSLKENICNFEKNLVPEHMNEGEKIFIDNIKPIEPSPICGLGIFEFEHKAGSGSESESWKCVDKSNFAYVAKKENEFAIVAVREDPKKDSWGYALFRLNYTYDENDSDSSKKRIDSMKDCLKKKSYYYPNEWWDENTEKLGEKVLIETQNYINLEQNVSEKWNKKSNQLLFKWMLRVLPTIALFENKDEKVRVYFLSTGRPETVYSSDNIVKKIICKITDGKDKRFQWFRTPCMTSFYKIGIDTLDIEKKDLPQKVKDQYNSLKYIGVGFLPDQSVASKTLILPFSSKMLDKVKKDVNREVILESIVNKEDLTKKLDVFLSKDELKPIYDDKKYENDSAALEEMKCKIVKPLLSGLASEYFEVVYNKVKKLLSDGEPNSDYVSDQLVEFIKISTEIEVNERIIKENYYRLVKESFIHVYLLKYGYDCIQDHFLKDFKNISEVLINKLEIVESDSGMFKIKRLEGNDPCENKKFDSAVVKRILKEVCNSPEAVKQLFNSPSTHNNLH